ncbi:MAG: amino acid adenylation domain-containing protein [Aquabacterium sp.]
MPTRSGRQPRLRIDYLHAKGGMGLEGVRRVDAHLQALLQGLADDPRTALGNVPNLQAPHTAKQDSTSKPKDKGFASVVEAFASHVRRVPQAPAVRDETTAWTYAQLHAASDKLARVLVTAGVGPDVRVGLHAERSCAFVLGLLAVLKAGGAYVPLDPQLPADRLAYQLDNSGARLVLSTKPSTLAVSKTLPVIELGIDQFDHDGHGSDLAVLSDESEWPQPLPQQAAYVIYTSGSTGQPKGVVVTHGALANYVQGVLSRLGLPSEAASMAMVSTVAADLGNTTLFGALCAGRQLHLISAERAFDPDRFGDYMREHAIDVLKIVPSHLQALMQAARPQDVLPRHTLIVGGEATGWALLDQIHMLKPTCRVINHYGPTETTVGVLTQAADTAWRQAPALPIGQPLPGSTVHVLDDSLNPVPSGVAGELYLGGAGLARGYQARAALTAERFVPSPFAVGERLYRSGDRVVQLSDGSLSFLGRTDDQVKIRGYRVEPREVATALLGSLAWLPRK